MTDIFYRIVRMINLCTCVFFLVACSSGSEEPVLPPAKPENPSISQPTITVDNELVSKGITLDDGSAQPSVSFSCTDDWTLSVAEARSDADWCVPSATSGSKGNVTVYFTVEENDGYEDRSVTVTIKCGATVVHFTITQKAADALLITKNKFEVGMEGGTVDVEVKANIDYKISIPETSKGWIKELNSRSLATRMHSFSIENNTAFDARQGEIHVVSGDKKEVIKIYQAPESVLILSKDECVVSDEGETIAVDVKSNVDYQVIHPSVDWLVDESVKHGSSHVLYYSVLPNTDYESRSASIIVKDRNSSLADTLKVIQTQKDAIILSQKEFKIGSDGATIEVKVKSNIGLEVKMPTVDWLSQVQSRGLVESVLMFRISANGTLEERKATIEICNTDAQVSESVTVIQEGLNNILLENNGVCKVVKNKPGNLSQIMNNKKDAVSLEISGPLDGDDIAFLRTMTHLETLNLSDAKIVEGGGVSCKTVNDEFPANFAYDASFKDKLSVIVLPKSILSIGANAFYGCAHITSIEIPESVEEIGTNAFYGCSLQTIQIPGKVRKIGSTIAVHPNAGLTSIAVDAMNPYFTSVDGVLFNKDCTELIAFPNGKGGRYVVAEGVKKITEAAFHRCALLTELILPETLLEIGRDAFSYCLGITQMVVPSSVAKLGAGAFSHCDKLSEITCNGSTPASLETGGTFENLPDDFILYVPVGTVQTYENAIGWSTYKDHILEVNTYFVKTAGTLNTLIPDDLKYSLTKLTVAGKLNGNDFKFIREMAGRDVQGNQTSGVLKELDIRKASIVGSRDKYFEATFSQGYNEVDNTLGGHVFYECNLETVVLPASITSIGYAAFRGSKISSVSIPESVGTLGVEAFYNCEELETITLPEGLRTIQAYAFSLCDNLKDVNIPETVTTIGEYAFNCPGLKNIYCYLNAPIDLPDFVFNSTSKSSCKLHVKGNLLQTFHDNPDWSGFSTYVQL